MDGLSSISTIGWAHFKLSGGWRMTGIAALGSALLLGGAVLLTSYDQDARRFDLRILYAWSAGVTLLQAIIFVGIGAQRIAAAVRRDITTNMIESHRLMPVRPWHAILGYLLGPTILVMAVGLANLLLSLGIAHLAGRAATDILPAHMVFFGCALFLWPAVAAWSFIIRFALIPISVLAFIYTASEGALSTAFPGMALFFSPFIGRSAFGGPGLLVSSYTGAHAVAAAMQLAFGIVFAIGAARRYARNDRPAFGMLFGTLLLALSVLSSIIATVWWDDFAPSIRRFAGGPAPEIETLVPSLIVLLMIALNPISSAAKFADTLRRRRVKSRRPMVAAGLVLLACILLLVLLPMVSYTMKESAIKNHLLVMPTLLARNILTAAIGLTALLSLYAVLNSVYSLEVKPTTPPALAFLWIIVIWFVPLIIDLFRFVGFGREGETMTLISAISPVGALIITWQNWTDAIPTRLIVGLVLQFGLILGLFGGMVWMIRRQDKFLREPPAPPTRRPPPAAIPPEEPATPAASS